MEINFNHGIQNIVGRSNYEYEYKIDDMNHALKSMDYTIKYLSNELLVAFFKQGMDFGIYGVIDKYKPKPNKVNSLLGYPNNDFLNDYIITAIKLGIIYQNEDGNLELNRDKKIIIKHPEYDKFMEDYIINYDHMTKLSKYALIGYNHPKILLNFIEDADIWDIILNTSYLKSCRNVIAKYLNLRNGDYILDVGCGSRSPEFYISKIFPKGKYTGIDISKNLLKIAEIRTKRWDNGSISLKHMDFCNAMIKNKYDYVICTYTLKYSPSLKIFLKKMMNALHSGGKLIIAEEFFKDTSNINIELFEFYNRLNKFFKNYHSKKEILDTLESMGYDIKHTSLSDGILVIEKI
ncbi:class I SAM-dependent methyltransferase [Methanothermococcus sp.]|uniref:class I SAM-dependent methyltransferase n=1 Tax=Methanothermococcus sp. TaxID=2614238 RepID=UPI0025F85E19|nr:class I SAM-dependent methyltransferase [Methanothermococcus sp.]